MRIPFEALTQFLTGRPPDAKRTERLFQMISAVMPVERYSDLAANGVLLPWRGVEIEGICDQGS